LNKKFVILPKDTNHRYLLGGGSTVEVRVLQFYSALALATEKTCSVDICTDTSEVPRRSRKVFSFTSFVLITSHTSITLGSY